MHVLLACHGVLDPLEERRGDSGGAGPAVQRPEIGLVEASVEHELDQGERFLRDLAEIVGAPGPDEVGGIEPVRQDEHPHFQWIRLVDGVGALGGARAGLV